MATYEPERSPTPDATSVDALILDLPISKNREEKACHPVSAILLEQPKWMKTPDQVHTAKSNAQRRTLKYH